MRPPKANRPPPAHGYSRDTPVTRDAIFWFVLWLWVMAGALGIIAAIR